MLLKYPAGQFLLKVIKLINALKAKLNNVRTPDSLVFTIFSDLHSSGNDEALDTLTKYLKMITDELKPDLAINLGDNLSMLGRDTHLSNEDVENILSRVLETLKSSVSCPLLNTNGNHDAVGTDFFDRELWNRVLDKNTESIISSRKNGYYYLDIGFVRLVFLSVPYGSDINKEHPTPLWAFGDEQLEWLKGALNTKNDVILFCHVPIFYKFGGDMERMIDVWTGTEVKRAFVKDLCGLVEDADKACEIIKQAGNVIACFSGHTHKDQLFPPLSENPLPCYQVVTRNPVPFSYAIDKGVYGIAIDVVVFNPKLKEFFIFRFGDGEDRHFTI